MLGIDEKKKLMVEKHNEQEICYNEKRDDQAGELGVQATEMSLKVVETQLLPRGAGIEDEERRLKSLFFLFLGGWVTETSLMMLRQSI